MTMSWLSKTVQRSHIPSGWTGSCPLCTVPLFDGPTTRVNFEFLSDCYTLRRKQALCRRETQIDVWTLVFRLTSPDLGIFVKFGVYTAEPTPSSCDSFSGSKGEVFYPSRAAGDSHEVSITIPEAVTLNHLLGQKWGRAVEQHARVLCTVTTKELLLPANNGSLKRVLIWINIGVQNARCSGSYSRQYKLGSAPFRKKTEKEGPSRAYLDSYQRYTGEAERHLYEGEDSAALRMERAEMGEEAKEEGFAFRPSSAVQGPISHFTLTGNSVNLIPEVAKVAIRPVRCPTSRTLVKTRMTTIPDTLRIYQANVGNILARDVSFPTPRNFDCHFKMSSWPGYPEIQTFAGGELAVVQHTVTWRISVLRRGHESFGGN
ncbi:hypothetical protein ARMSODRAFT_981779 [Armillaria solidipes]|uniref:Uncharacterized protein n=1 Tax=Armillaria solidipes TaxID=1076256 RepID=A0A2H3B8W8_9AGAR|nr:hypothetical protein ARMSODRAFT_981779 [Armillaria solidipes]